MTTYKQGSIALLRQQTGDQTAVDTSESTTTSPLYQDKVTLTFTPSTTGDYLIMAFAQVSGGNTLKDMNVKLYHSTTSTSYGEMRRTQPTANTEYEGWATMVKLSSLSGSQTFKIQYKKTGIGTITAKIRDAHIIAIRLDNYPENYYFESRSRSTTTSTSLQNKISGFQAVGTGDYLIFSCCQQDCGSTSDSSIINFSVNSELLMDSSVQPYATNDAQTFFSVHKRGLSGSPTFALQYKSGAGATVGISEASIAFLKLTGDPTVRILGKTEILGKTSIL